MTVSRKVNILFVWFVLLAAWPGLVFGDTPVTIDPQVLRDFHLQVKNMETSKREFVQSSVQMTQMLERQGKAFKDFEEGSEGQFSAANGMLDGMLTAIEDQLDPLEKFSKDLKRMHAINARAAETAKPDKNAVRGSRSEVAVYNKMVQSLGAWDEHALSQFDSPELQRNRVAMRKALKAMRNELEIAQANGNRFTYDTFQKLDARLLDYRLQLDAYVNSLKGMVNGIVQARQTGEFNATFSSLDNLLSSIDDNLIPEFLSPLFHKAIMVVAGGGRPSSDTIQGGPVDSVDDFDELILR